MPTDGKVDSVRQMIQDIVIGHSQNGPRSDVLRAAGPAMTIVPMAHQPERRVNHSTYARISLRKNKTKNALIARTWMQSESG